MSAADPHARAQVLLLAAHQLELEPLAATLGATLDRELAGRRVTAVAVGVGMTLAGAGAMRALLQWRPEQAILLGSYGIYPGRGELVPGRLLVPTELCALDASVLAGHAAFPEPMPTSVVTDAGLQTALCALCSDALSGALGTTLAITTDDALAAELGQRSGCAGENLEALAVGLACKSAGVPFAAVLGCTNEVGARGRRQWREHHALAAQTSTACVVRWLLGG
ncbi:MAG: hypothetical protein ACHQ53_08810 [Polyangiales bacterium]